MIQWPKQSKGILRHKGLEIISDKKKLEEWILNLF